MCIDSLIAINSLNLAAFPVYGNAMNKGKAAKLKLFIAFRESIHIARVRKPKNRYLQIDLQTIVMCRGRSNQEITRVAANFVHLF